MENSKWLNRPPLNNEAAKALLNMSLEDKFLLTCTNILDWDIFTGGKWYISFSGGKDSTVLLYIAARLLNHSTAPRTLNVLFCDTGLEYPEIRKFVPWYIEWLQNRFQKVKINYTRIRPKKNFFDTIQKYGYPLISKDVAIHIKSARRGNKNSIDKFNGTYRDKNGNISKISDFSKYSFLIDSPFLIGAECCNLTKKQPAKSYEHMTKYRPVIATMASEGLVRRRSFMESGCNAYEGSRPTSRPMSVWNEQDVLRYILKEEIPICSVYGEIKPVHFSDFYESSLFDDVPLKCTGCDRTGCTFCAFGAHLEKGENRFQRLRRTHPKHWNYAINGGEWDPFDGKWKPSKQPGHIGLGMGRVLDYIGVKYE